MAGRHLVLAIGAVLVLGLAVYLWLAVRTPTAAPAVARTARPAASAPSEPASPAVEAAAPAPRTAAIPAASGSAAPTPPAASDGSDGAAGAGSGSAFGYSEDKLNAVMAEANTAYDRGDYEEARTIAGRVLLRQPSNARMLRILVSSSCIEGDLAAAQASLAMLSAEDQERMRIRCARYGVNLTVSATK